MQDAQQMLVTGTLLRGRYLVKNLVGRGDSGAVYLVQDQNAAQPDQQLFALKETRDLNKQERLQLTFKSVTLRQVKHPSLPQIYHIFNDDRRNRVGIIMDFVDGPDLETLCQHQPHERFPWPEVERMMAPIFDAIGYLHRQADPIVHGDIKPVNILLAQPGERPMLVDIGVVREAGSESVAVYHRSGYKAPEQYGKSVDERTDIYGLGATCYTLLTGIIPIDAIERGARISQGQADPLQPVEALVPTVPSHVAQAILRSLSLPAANRFASVEAFWHALQAPPSVNAPAPAENKTVAPIPAPPSSKKSAPTLPSLPCTPIPAFLAQSKPFTPLFTFVKRNILPLALLVMIVLAGAGLGILSFAQSQHTPASSDKQASTSTLRSTTPTAGSTVSIAAPTSSPGTYPSIVGSYAGTILDITITSNGASLIFQGIHQFGGSIAGYFTAGQPIGISGPFIGAIDHGKNFHFIVRDDAGHPLLFVEGVIQTPIYLSGDFYRCTTGATPESSCPRASQGSGIWSVKLIDNQ